MPLNLALTTEQKISVTLTPTTAAGNPATLDGAPVWAVTEGDATVEVSEDGLTATIISGEVGISTITVTADADLDEGEVREIGDVIALNVVAPEAAGLGLSAGEPELK